MKIISLQAENVKRLTAVKIKPDGNLVEITGRNGQGKTSVLDSIWWALAGTRDVQAKPIRAGAERAVIKLDLGALRVTRTFNAQEDGSYTTSIKVENEDGATYGSPQKMLDALVGELTFDPLAFTRMKPVDQLEALKRFVPGVDFDAIETANADDYSARTDVNRRAKALRAQIAGLEDDSNADQVMIDEAELVAKLERAGQHNADVERQRAARTAYQEETGRLSDDAHSLGVRIERLKNELAELEQQKEALDERIAKRVKQADDAQALPEPIITAALSEQIATARRNNSLIERAQRVRADRERMTAEATTLETESETLTNAMAKRSDAKNTAIAKAKMPISGIGFGDGMVLLDGVPFDQGSDAEQLRASIAIGVAMNPKLRVMRVRDGSLLDPDSMKLLAEFADASDCQIWIETVASGRPGAVLIEDGHVKSDTPAPTTKAAEGALL